ncbi:hypothetical protein B566_EDAN012646 [Ephemera danica]|nr:hypothetical protein B566_EDAN012646 [Ephemera danica]
MSFINNCSHECTKAQLDLFLLPETQCSVESADYVYYKPISSLETNAPIEIQISAIGDEYIDVGDTFLHVVATADSVGSVNNFLHSMFSDVGVTMNGKFITAPLNLYPYRAYLETLFNYNDTAKTSHQTLDLYTRKMNKLTGENLRLKNRCILTSASQEIAVFGKLNVDIFGQSKYLINNVNISVTLTRSKNSFCLMSPSAHSKILSKTTAKYQISRVEIKNYTIPAGLLTVSLNNIIMGQLPVRVIVDGTPVLSVSLLPEFSGIAEDYCEAYYSTFSGTSIHTKDDGWDQSASSTQWSLRRNGVLALDVRFDEQLPNTVSCILYCEYQNLIEICSDRRVTADF